MKNIARLITLILIVVLSSCKTERSNYYIWKITSNDNPYESYLFGTIHMIEASKYQLPSEIDDILENVNQVIFEVDLTSDSIMTATNRLSKSHKDYLNLSDYTDYDQIELINYFYDSIRFPIHQLVNVNPIYVQMLFYKSLFHNKQMLSIEMEILKRIDKTHTSILGLEGYNEQTNTIDSTSHYEQVIRNLFYSIEKRDSVRKAFIKLFDNYVNGTLEQYANLGNDSIKSTMLLTNRNVKWVNKLDKELSSCNNLIAVGCMHMFGDYGLVNLLRNKGYKVEKLQLN